MKNSVLFWIYLECTEEFLTLILIFHILYEFLIYFQLYQKQD